MNKIPFLFCIVVVVGGGGQPQSESETTSANVVKNFFVCRFMRTLE
jgi:hypothetical protein